MKHLARIAGIIGGIGAIIWAMRDRFVSVAISREPEAPAFRDSEEQRAAAPTQTEAPPRPPTAGSAKDAAPDITTVTGIGPVYATRLEGAGISTLGDLATLSAESVAEAADVSVDRAKDWIEQAADLTSGS